VGLEDQLTALFLQLRAFGVSVPERVDLSNQQLGALTADRAALVRSLDDLAQAVAARRADLEPRVERRRAEVQALDRLVQAAEFRTGRGAVVAIAGQATPPERAVDRKTLMNMGLGATLGFMIGLVVVIVREWLRGTIHSPGSVELEEQVPQKV